MVLDHTARRHDSRPGGSRLTRRAKPFLTCLILSGLLLQAGAALAQDELSYRQYRALAWAADRMDHLATFEPLLGEPGMFLAIGERFGTIVLVRIHPRGAEQVWKSVQLSGVPEELLVADLDGDTLDDALICRTTNAKIYVWSLDGYRMLWESLTNEYKSVTCFTVANVDDDMALEIVMNADGKIVFVDGSTFNREFTSINDYSATMVRCGDVDGDQRVEIVLNSGQVLDSVSGEIEWEDEPFFSRIELLDVDGDGLPEVVTEDHKGGPVKVYDIDYRKEVRFQ